MSFDHRKYRPFAPVHKPDRRWPDRVMDHAPDFCAVDLRDGNQALVKPMSVEQKRQLFLLLVSIGLKEIEVGFPAASQPDYDFLRMLIDDGLIPEDVTIQVLTQAREELIARTYEAVAGAPRACVHLYNSTSTVQREQVFGMDRQGIKAIAVHGAELVKKYAAKYPNTQFEFEYSPESFTGTELDFACEVVDAVNDVWRPDLGQRVVINLPATVEMSTPNVYADMIEWMCDHIVMRKHLRVSVHTHNDRGCGVAAAELAVLAGADRVEGTLLGNGERTGNMDMVVMAMNLYSQGIDPRIDLSNVREIIETVEACTEIQTHPRHPWVGELVFTAFSGSHQDAIRKCLTRRKLGDIWDVAYLPIDPADLGRRYEEVVRINSQSGKGGVLHVLERDFGITLPRWLQIDFSRIVQQEAERTGGEVQADRIRELFETSYVHVEPSAKLIGYDVKHDAGRVQARVRLGDGTEIFGEGSGAVEAVVEALAKRSGVRLQIETFDELALSGGADASALACVRMNAGNSTEGQVGIGVAFAKDTTGAALQAVLSAATRLIDASDAAAAAE